MTADDALTVNERRTKMGLDVIEGGNVLIGDYPRHGRAVQAQLGLAFHRCLEKGHRFDGLGVPCFFCGYELYGGLTRDQWIEAAKEASKPPCDHDWIGPDDGSGDWTTLCADCGISVADYDAECCATEGHVSYRDAEGRCQRCWEIPRPNCFYCRHPAVQNLNGYPICALCYAEEVRPARTK